MKMLMRLSSLVPLLVVAGSAQHALVLRPLNRLALSAPDVAVNSFRIELRFHNPAVTLLNFQTVHLIDLPAGFSVRFMGPSFNAPLSFQDNLDGFTSGQGNLLYLDTSGRADIILRLQRDTTAKLLQAELWNADGSDYVSETLSIDAINPLLLPSQASVGDLLNSSAVDYIRMYSSLLPFGTAPFGQPAGDLLDLEFENDLTDSSPKHIPVVGSGLISYTSSPAYPPYVSQGSQRTLTGASVQLDGSSSFSLNNTNNPLTYKWALISGPTACSWSSQSIAKPTITGLSFGSYVISLTVTDSSGVSASNTLKYGYVSVDGTGRVVPADPYVTTLFGPMLPWGANPWPYFDTQHKVLADFFGGLQNSDYLNIWDTAQAGSVTVANGSSVVTGTGTTFQSTFCANGTTGNNGASVVFWYPIQGSAGQLGRRAYTVKSCESDSSLTLARAYITSRGANKMSYAYMDNTSIDTWINGSNNANYYDNVLAFYNLYYRSGLDDYLNYARTLADRWWTMPWVDQGRDCSDGDGTTCLAPRLQAVTGLVARALDGRSDMWPGLRALIAYDYAYVDGPAVQDVREDGYATAFLSLAALFDPDSSTQAKWNAKVTGVIETFWAPNVLAAGNWTNPSFGYASWNGYSGTATVTNGSTKVSGIGTTWQAAWFAGNAFWTANGDLSGGDARSYTATVSSQTELQLNIPYQGPSVAGRAWETNNLVGFGTQPYMLGTAGAAFRYAYLATHDARLPQFITGIAGWLSSEGYRSSARGLWYGRLFPNCEPISDTNPWCSGGTVVQSRFLAGEVVAVLAEAYSLGGSSSIQAFGQNLYSAMYGGSGGPGTDGVYVTDIATGGWAMQSKSAKDFGFFYGFGFGTAWPGASNPAP